MSRYNDDELIPYTEARWLELTERAVRCLEAIAYNDRALVALERIADVLAPKALQETYKKVLVTDKMQQPQKEAL